MTVLALSARENFTKLTEQNTWSMNDCQISEEMCMVLYGDCMFCLTGCYMSIHPTTSNLFDIIGARFHDFLETVDFI